MNQKLLLSVFAIGLLGCDNQVENKSFDVPMLPPELLEGGGVSKPDSSLSEKKKQTPLVQKTAVEKSERPDVQKASNPVKSMDEASGIKPMDDGSQVFVEPKFVEIRLVSPKGEGLYDIIVSTDGMGFDVELAGETILTSYPMSKMKQQKINPLMAEVASNICLIHETQNTLSDLNPKGLLSRITRSDNGKNVIKKSRLKNRILTAEREIFSLLDRVIKISKTSDSMLKKRTETLLIDSNQDVYDVAISPDALEFDVKKNGSLVLSSEALSPLQFDRVQPMMVDVFQKVQQLEKDDEKLSEITPKTFLGDLSNTQSNRHIITRSRLEVRTQILQQEIINDLIEVLDKLNIENEPSTDEKRNDLPENQPTQQTPRQMKRMLSIHPNYLKTQNQRV